MRYIDIIVDICNQMLLGVADGNSKMELPELSVEEWDNLFGIASIHGVLPVVLQVFEQRQIKSASVRQVIVKWYAVVQNFKKEYQKRILTMQELSMMFADKGFDVMFFKGAALAQFYPHPECRVFSDIDFYLYGKWQEGIKVMKQHGIENTPYYHHNTNANLHGILLENHYDFVERLNHQQNLILDDELKKMANEEGRSVKAFFLGDEITNAYVMTPTMNAIFLIRHMSAHFVSESIPLRMLYDWILFLMNSTKDVDWNRVERLYKASGMMGFVGIVQGLLQKYFQVEIPLCPVKPLLSGKTEKVWKSIACPPKVNLNKQNGLSYYLYETKVFLANRWKHRIVYPGESYFFLFLRYAWSVLKKKQ